MREVFLVLIIITCCSWMNQKTNQKFLFSDNFGNRIIIEDIDKLPKQLDTVFLKTNLNGLYFIDSHTNSNYKFDFLLTDFKVIKRNKYYLFKVTTIPITKDIQEVLKYQNGFCNFEMTIKGKKIEKVELKSSEI